MLLSFSQNLFDWPQIIRDRALSPQEIQAIGSFLSDSVAEFAGLASSDVALKVPF